jgi:hypothetical protein
MIKRITPLLLFIGLAWGESDSTEVVGPEWISFLSYYGAFSTNANQAVLGNNFQNHTINKLKIMSFTPNEADFKTSIDIFDYYNVHTPGFAFDIDGIKDTLDLSYKYYSVLPLGKWKPVLGKGQFGLIKTDAKVHWLAFQNFNKPLVYGSEGVIIQEDKYGYTPGIEVSLSFDTYLSGVELSYLRTYPIDKEHIKPIDGVFLNYYVGLSFPQKNVAKPKESPDIATAVPVPPDTTEKSIIPKFDISVPKVPNFIQIGDILTPNTKTQNNLLLNKQDKNNQLKNESISYNLPVRFDIILGAGQYHYLDLNPKKSVFAYGIFNDIQGSIFFDELEKEFFEKILKKIHKSIPKKYRHKKYKRLIQLVSPIAFTDSTIENETTSVRKIASYTDEKYINWYSNFPSTISYSKNSDYELLMFNIGPGIVCVPYNWIDFIVDFSLTTLMYHDKMVFEKPKWAIRPSAFFGLEFRTFPKRWPIVLGVQYGKRYLWPIYFYNDKKFSQIEQKMITLSFNFNKEFPIKSSLLD